MMLTCRKDMGVNSTSDLKGKSGVWFYGNEYPFLSWMSRLGLKTDGSSDGVTVLKQGWGVEPLTEGQVGPVYQRCLTMNTGLSEMQGILQSN